jgi:choice-of-anchor B domain-containing protein
MKKLLIILQVWVSATLAAQYAASNFSLIGYLDPETTFNSSGSKYSGCWGWYQAEKNKEYAIACSNRGTYWIDVTNPATPTVSAYRAGKKSGCIWREAKSYKNFLYVISDDAGNNSFQIFDMSYLPDSVHKVYDGTSLLINAHTAWVDGDKLYLASVTRTNNTSSSMSVYSLANPSLPALLRDLDQDYPFINHAHDMYVRKDTVYASCGYQGLYVYRFTSANTFTQMGSLTSYTYSGYNHSSALTPDGKTLVFADEVPASLPFKVANVSNIANIQVLATANQFSLTTPHNPFVVDNQYCFMSSYQDGMQLYDISSPASPTLAGYFDTYPQAGGNVNNYPSGATYNGNWGCYPFLPSGNIFVLDMKNGVFMLKTSLYKGPPVTAGFTLPPKVCVGAPVSFTNGSSGSNTYSWSVPQGSVTASTPTGATASFTAGGIKTVTLYASNAAYTVSTTHTISVVAVTAAITHTNAACSTCSNGIAAVTPTGGTAPYSYTWSPKGGSTNKAINIPPGCYTVSIKDADGCASTASTCVSFFTGLADSWNGIAPAVFPNPARDVLHIVYPEKSYGYILYSMSGTAVARRPEQAGDTDVSLTGFPAGVYLLEITSGSEKTIKQVVVE